MIEIRNFTRFKLDKKLLTGLAKKVSSKNCIASTNGNLFFISSRK